MLRGLTHRAVDVRAGLPDPDESARILPAQLDGLLYDALVRPFAGGSEPEQLRRAVDVMLRGHLGQPRGPLHL